MQAPQAPIPGCTDLRDMLRTYLIRRSLVCMDAAAERRQASLREGTQEAYQAAIRQSVKQFYGPLPAGPTGRPCNAVQGNTYEKKGYRIENVLFESFPGWQVNGTVYVPLDYAPPFPAVVVPVGHSGKQFENYQLPCQFFARSGYLTITFDPPGQAGEKQPGNDHFLDGVRCYPVGETSSRYFVGDALRCLDYLATRPDVDTSHGFAMTGVSGGGTTTTLAGLLDDRITVMGPSCCVSPLADLDITQCYAGCPETHMWRRYAEGVDEIDLICAAVPVPTLLMAGEKDEVFRIEDTRALAREAETFYTAAGAADRFEFFEDATGHCYSLRQARRFTAFMDRWLRTRSRPEAPTFKDADFHLDPEQELRCCPDTGVNMQTLSADRSKALREMRTKVTEKIRQAAMALVAYDPPSEMPIARVGEPFRVWTHRWQQILLRPEEGIELPATFLYREDGTPAPVLLHFDDRGRNRLLAQNGLLAKAVGFLNGSRDPGSVFTVDLRGWGDTSMALYPYEIASWGSTDRFCAYISAALGDHIMGMRTRDGLGALAYLRSLEACLGNRIVISGCGLGGIVAQHVAAIDGAAGGLVVWQSLLSFENLLASVRYDWPADVFMPNVLLHYDLPDLISTLTCPVRIISPFNAEKSLLPDKTLRSMQEHLGPHALVVNGDENTVVSEIQDLLMEGK